MLKNLNIPFYKEGAHTEALKCKQKMKNVENSKYVGKYKKHWWIKQ